jgi:tRNA pseudouridine38-40 synthase
VLGEPPNLSVAGRTDAGVHAAGQVASFVPPGPADPLRIQRAVNGMLAPEVVVVRAVAAPSSFDARRSARGREYRYRVDIGPVPDPFAARFTWHRPGELQIDAMRRAADLLVGERDFASFCRIPKETDRTVRNLRRLTVLTRGRLVLITAAADSFLHQMVRALVGTLVSVGEGRTKPSAIPKILEARDRSAAGPIAPPHGLTLLRVIYGRPA